MISATSPNVTTKHRTTTTVLIKKPHPTLPHIAARCENSRPTVRTFPIFESAAYICIVVANGRLLSIWGINKKGLPTAVGATLKKGKKDKLNNYG